MPDSKKIPLSYASDHSQARDRRTLGSRVLDALKTFLFVAPLTLLIWIYAEREQLQQVKGVGATVEVRSSRDVIVTVLSPADRRLFLDVECPNNSIDLLRRRLADSLSPLVIILPEDKQPGYEGELNVIEQLNQDSTFRSNAATVLRTNPPLLIKVDAKASRPAKIQPNAKIVGKVVFEPDTAIVQGPAGVLNNIPEKDLILYADFLRFAGRPVGQYDETVPLTLAVQNPNLTYPKTVRVKVDIQASLTETLQYIPVVVQLPAVMLQMDKYKIDVKERTLPNVIVRGPTESIQQIKAGTAVPAPAAVVTLTLEELQQFAATPGEKNKRLGAVNYQMPLGVTVDNPERDVTVTVVEKTGP